MEANYVYLCDPDLNPRCKKTSCQRECRFTTHKEASLDGKRYRFDEFINNFKAVEDDTEESV
jgi:hypothetical protein